MSEEREKISIDSPINKPVAEAPQLEPIPGLYRVMRRNGKVTAYDSHKIVVAMTKAFLSVEGSSAAASSRIHNEVENLTDKVDHTIKRRFPNGGVIHIEDIQDQVELAIMRAGYQDVARAYVIYREDRSKARKLGVEQTEDMPISKNMVLDDGSAVPIDYKKLKNMIAESCLDIDDVSTDLIFNTIDKNIYDGIKKSDLSDSILISVRPLIEKDPNYSFVLARLLSNSMSEEAYSFLEIDASDLSINAMEKSYPNYFKSYIKKGVELKHLDPELLNYDLEFLTKNIDLSRDMQFTYLGLQTLYDRYFIHHNEVRFELPQAFFMRVAMGLAINEDDREAKSIEFYKLLSSFDFMSSTPTLFNSATLKPQLSSCYLSTLPDDLRGIFEGISDDAMLSKFAGGLGNDDWTLFSPSDTPDLHDLYGLDFEEKYMEYEDLAKSGGIKNFKTVNAVDIWRKILSMLFETGHPWITFKDPCNVRSPQQHKGVVNSSNLCTEITLNTSKDEIAVCNLGSVNLAAHITEAGKIDTKKLKKTIMTAMRMLDNVIEYNYYSVDKAKNSNLKHRPVGLGIMGFQDALYKIRVPYESEEAVAFADKSMEYVSYFAIEASMELAKERGAYESFEGSLWSQGILPIDSLRNLKEIRGKYLDVNLDESLKWDDLRDKIKKHGMRNSNTLAIAPTATISNICGVSQSIEPTYQNLYVKSNLSGEFTVINPYLIKDLKERDLWDEVMIKDLKYFDGQLQPINRVPDDLKSIYSTCFEIDTRWLVEAAARRQKWIDQSQSLNLYIPDSDGKKLDSAYKLAWIRGLKTTYYLRSLGATHVEKSTSDNSGSNLNAVKSDEEVKQCLIDDPECEACQ